MPRCALVTGATGLVGSHIVERLARDGWSVRALVRSHGYDPGKPDVECIVGDVLDEAAFVRAAAGCDVIFHTAAAITDSGGWEVYRQLNIGGTQNAIAAAERSGARLLHLSSVAVYGNDGRYRAPGPDGAVVKTDEETPLGPLPEKSYYARSKRESEALVLDAHSRGRIWATAVRPDVIYGRRDRQFVPRIVRLMRFHVVPLIGGGRSTMAIVNAANVADGAVLAAQHDQAGGRVYNLANEGDVSVREFFRLAARGLGIKVRFMQVPLAVAQAGFGAAMVVVKAVTRGHLDLVSSGSLAFVTRDNPFTSDRARRELGWTPSIRPEDSIPDAFRWCAATAGSTV